MAGSSPAIRLTIRDHLAGCLRSRPSRARPSCGAAGCILLFSIRGRPGCGLGRRGEWREVLAEDRTAGPAETAAARIDWVDWLRSLSRHQRAIACTLAGGESTGVAAWKFCISAGGSVSCGPGSKRTASSSTGKSRRESKLAADVRQLESPERPSPSCRLHCGLGASARLRGGEVKGGASLGRSLALAEHCMARPSESADP